MFDPYALTMAQIETFEEYAGMGIGELDMSTGDAGTVQLPPARALTALALILRQNTDPSFTIEQARALNLGELLAIVEAGEQEAAPDPEG